ncbi:MAG: hypothetical protein FWE54_02285 [Methanimicrococcus sp.]|nr:hypothetical protein [Methanimicrococcus sp.]
MTTNFCSNCGNPAADPDTKVCTNCGKPLYMAQTDSASYENDQNAAENETPNSQYIVQDEKSPFLAIILSFLWVGLGQLYNGRFWKGIIFNVGSTIGMVLIFPGLAIWIYSCWDAYKEAEKMNRGEIPFTEPTLLEILVFIFFWVIILFAIVIMAAVMFSVARSSVIV